MRRRLTVTTAASSARLTTIAAAQAEIAGVSDTAQVERWIDAASGAIARHTGRVMARESVTETFWLDRRGYPALRLQRTPVVSIASVTVDSVALDIATEVLLEPDSGILRRLSYDFPADWLAARVEVAYVGGWLLPGAGVTTLPAEIQRACQITVAAFASGQYRDPQLRSESADGIGSQSWLDPRAQDGALPWSAAALLAPWVRPVVE
jgi:hypothetical protein